MINLKLFDDVMKVGSRMLLVEEELNDDVEFNRRYDICKKCAFYNATRDKCIICKCYMSVKCDTLTHLNPDTMRIEITHCPKNYWEDGSDLISQYYNSIS